MEVFEFIVPSVSLKSHTAPVPDTVQVPEPMVRVIALFSGSIILVTVIFLLPASNVPLLCVMVLVLLKSSCIVSVPPNIEIVSGLVKIWVPDVQLNELLPSMVNAVVPELVIPAIMVMEP